MRVEYRYPVRRMEGLVCRFVRTRKIVLREGSFRHRRDEGLSDSVGRGCGRSFKEGRDRVEVRRLDGQIGLDGDGYPVSSCDLTERQGNRKKSPVNYYFLV